MFGNRTHGFERSGGRNARMLACESALGVAMPELAHLPFAAEWLAEAGSCEADAAPADERDDGFDP